MADNGAVRARGLARALDIIDYLHRRGSPARINEIVSDIGAPKSTVYELTSFLVEQRVLEYDGGDGLVFLGRRLYFWGNSYLEHYDLVRDAKGYLRDLAQETGEMAQLCMLSGSKFTIVLVCEGAHQFRLSADIGKEIPLPWTASGRLLVSDMTDEEIEAFIPQEDFDLPDGSELDRCTFIAEARQARKEGFYSCGTVNDSFTYCFAAPVYDEKSRCVASLCLVSPREEALKRFEHYRDLLIGRAGAFSRRLSAPGPPDRK